MQTIDNTQDLGLLCQRLAKHPYITVDLEFIREKTYFPLLCLIQVASEEETAIIDPLAEGIDLQSFFALMQNRDVTKVFHSCRQDVEIIFELSGIIPQPLFDTQVAAMVCGFGESISYERLVKAILGIELDKTDRLSNWQLRPLDEHQLEYAAGDVTHLLKIYRHLKEQMTAGNRLHWIDEEMEILSRGTTYVAPPEDAWLKIRHRSHNARVLSALKALAAWRECRAREKNVPRHLDIHDCNVRSKTLRQFDDTPSGFGILHFTDILKFFLNNELQGIDHDSFIIRQHDLIHLLFLSPLPEDTGSLPCPGSCHHCGSS